MNPLIFREYDIRGDAERDLDDTLVRDLGRAFGTWLGRDGARRIVVSRDCRLSSPRLHAALCEGLLEVGMSIVDIGVAPTPLMYFTVFDAELDGGIQITGSHNPPGDNGFKMMRGRDTLFGDDIQTLRMLIERRDFDTRPHGTRQSYDPAPRYLGFMRGNISLRRPLRVALDAGNGAGGPIALAALREVGLDPVPLYCDMDGRFPHHHPDPSLPENLEALITQVRDRQLDLGIALDGDGDRIGVIDARGQIIWGDKLMVLLSRSLLEAHPGATILGEVKSSQALYDDIASRGGRGIVWKTGHSLIKRKMKEEGALLAGEVSGHIFFADRYFGFDDAVYAALRLVELLAAQDAPLHTLLADLPEAEVTPEIRVDCPDDLKFDVVDRVRAHFQARQQVIDVDGARILFDDGWGLVRASNTQPALVLRFEAPTAKRLAAIRQQVESVVEEARHALQAATA